MMLVRLLFVFYGCVIVMILIVVSMIVIVLWWVWSSMVVSVIGLIRLRVIVSLRLMCGRVM